ncbi:discoidin domain-containing protein [Glycomyces niveus]|uniref:Discoidin domain-containing protein n=1 Tax=Glycomyces niveus TaxID=2820287 RepID=A0ABS3U6U0_9ACTN|nr:discoidin domain-containing protein [Glycomyces sp. NEAU-S30]MBO3734489.1 discoidin domain-containing protein [Glycomyces sp. NEAU-S30]
MHPPTAATRDRRALPRRAAALMAAMLLSLGLVQLVAPGAEPAQAATTCDVQFNSTTSEAGFSHPGIGLTEPIIENVRTQLAAGAEPWATGFEALKKSGAAGEGVKPSNAGTDPTKPRTTAFNAGTRGMFEADGLKAYTQAVMHVLTGKEVHRSNALAIIRNWAQMDPTKFEYYVDSHIHNGMPLFRMAGAAELLRYTSCGDDPALVLTENEAKAFSDNLIKPAIATFMSSPDRFMNQHNYPLLGSMAGSIFMDDTELYHEKVEWFTVNETAKDEGFNGSVSRLARWVDKNDKTGEPIDDPHVQLTEMGRDQAHGGGNLTNFAALSRMMMAQGTEVDPVDGTVSTAEDAVGPYEFLDDRILKAADYFWQFMSGRDPEWTPIAYAISPDGTIRDTYNHIADGYRGRYATASFWEMYYYYTYQRGEDVEAIAPFFAEAYAKRPTPVQIGWDGRDGGGDSWMFAPAEAAGETAQVPNPDPDILEIEQRYMHLAGNVEEGDGFVSMAGGSKISYVSGGNNKPQQGFLVRTEGPAVIHLGGVSHDDTVRRDTSVTVPDTGGEWRYVTVSRAMGDILFIETEGAAVDIDHININAQAELDGPVYPEDAAERVIGWDGADLTVDLAATGDGITYSATDLPDGAALDTATGRLTWTGEDSGTITVAADDGTSVAARTVVLDAAADREEALALAEEDFEPEDGYESASEAAFTAARDAAEAKLQEGTDAEFATALAGMVAAADGLRLISPKTSVDGSLDFPGLLHSSTAKEFAPLLVDGDNQTGLGYPLAVNKSHTFDFGPDFRVSAREFGFQSNIFADRLANSAVFGSNDGVNWTRLTPGVTEFTQDFNTLEVEPELRDDQFRYVKVQMIEQLPDVLYGIIRGVFEMTEFHIYGERHEIGNQISKAAMTSEDAVAGKVAVGDTVNVAVTTRQPVDAVTVNVMGIEAAAASEDGVNWLAPVVLDGVEPGSVTLTVDYADDGKAGPTLYGPTEGASLFAGGNRDQLIDVADLATVLASDKQWPGNGLPADQVGYLLFDGDENTAGDLNTGVGSYYTVDFGEGAAVRLDEVYFLPRLCCTSRSDGTIVQGSNDGQTWTTLTEPLTGTKAGVWQWKSVADDTHYRYFKIYNANRWHGNLGEVQFFGDLA